ncbi:DHH family phosphoesterase [Fretibacter rubidus]|uniref:DHH family phosphoesterase n=1 Tax=Fretibacter rubidus TaxID=570162 RepID=UPI00352AE936
MRCFDVFNGDADGIISLVMLRRAEPRDAVLVTGRKRDIKLLDRVDARAGDHLTVLDISMLSNMDALTRILSAGASVFYADHHKSGDIPDHPNLEAVIHTAPEVCTAVLIDQIQNGSYREWAITAAFGDNFPAMAKRLAKTVSDKGNNLPLAELERLGMLINYNGYGGSEADLLFHPAELYRQLAPYDTPMDFLSAKRDVFEALDAGFNTDMATVECSDVIDETPKGLILGLADSAASRRASGTYGNQLAQDFPNRAHAILTAQDGGYLVSIRAPLSNRRGADDLALQFETGGGRSAAAGINHLSNNDLERFVKAFRNAF